MSYLVQQQAREKLDMASRRWQASLGARITYLCA